MVSSLLLPSRVKASNKEAWSSEIRMRVGLSGEGGWGGGGEIFEGRQELTREPVAGYVQCAAH